MLRRLTDRVQQDGGGGRRQVRVPQRIRALDREIGGLAKDHQAIECEQNRGWGFEIEWWNQAFEGRTGQQQGNTQQGFRGASLAKSKKLETGSKPGKQRSTQSERVWFGTGQIEMVLDGLADQHLEHGRGNTGVAARSNSKTDRRERKAG